MSAAENRELDVSEQMDLVLAWAKAGAGVLVTDLFLEFREPNRRETARQEAMWRLLSSGRLVLTHDRKLAARDEV